MTLAEKELARTFKKILDLHEKRALLLKYAAMLEKEVGPGSQIDLEDEIEEKEPDKPARKGKKRG